jgi:hypothetical protein
VITTVDEVLEGWETWAWSLPIRSEKAINAIIGAPSRQYTTSLFAKKQAKFNVPKALVGAHLRRVFAVGY